MNIKSIQIYHWNPIWKAKREENRRKTSRFIVINPKNYTEKYITVQGDARSAST